MLLKESRMRCNNLLFVFLTCVLCEPFIILIRIFCYSMNQCVKYLQTILLKEKLMRYNNPLFVFQCHQKRQNSDLSPAFSRLRSFQFEFGRRIRFCVNGFYNISKN